MSLRICCLLCVVACSSISGAGAESEQVSTDWQQQYQELKRDISDFQNGKRGSSPHIFDRQSLVFPEDRLPAGIVIRRTAALLEHIQSLHGSPDLGPIERRLDELRNRHDELWKRHSENTENTAKSKPLYLEACAVRRELVLSNPLLDFDEILFATKHGNREGVLQCWNYGYRVTKGGGLFKASGIKEGRPRIRNIIKDSVVESGRLKGTKLGTQGAFNLPALDYDGKTIVFSYVERTGIKPPWPLDVFEGFTHETCFHLFKVNSDGTGLVQLTDGRRNDYHPCFLPNGRVVFVSDRRNIMDRCQGGAPFREFSQPCGTMHSMKRDGSDMICISYHETTELQPSVDNNGMLLYTRWDYVDRDFSAAHNFWICYPDGRDPRAPHGNYPLPHHTFDGKWRDGRADRPWAEYSIKGIPGSHRYMLVAGKHHISGPWGTLVLLDTNVKDDNKMSQVTLFHNYEMMDEAKGYHGDMDEGLPKSPMYADPWPLSEAFVIAAQGNRVLLLDKFGNRELLFAATREECAGIDRIRSPIPLKARPKPVAVPTMTYQGERYRAPGHKRATIAVMSVYESDFEWPKGVKVKSLRVLQLFPYPWHSPWQDKPRLGPGSGVSARAVLGVVPVEADGSAYFEAPVEKAIYFQALDENGMAVQSMRSATYVHPGEKLVCRGCHEGNQKAPSQTRVPLALRRAPSKLVPNLEDGSCPLTFARLVEPLLESKCNPCHEKNKKPRPNLEKYRFWYHGTGGHNGLGKVHGGYRTIAGRFGAIQTGLAKVMLKEHHRKALTMQEINRVTLWVDANSNDLGAYYDEDKQRAGEVVWPVIDMDPENPAGIDLVDGRPAPASPSASMPLMKQSEALIKGWWPDMKPTQVRGGIPARAARDGRGVDISEAVAKFAPEWKVADCGRDCDPGLRARWGGRKSVLVTHPLDRRTGCVLSRKVAVAAGKTTKLKLDVGHDQRGDWTLIVRADGRELVKRAIGRADSRRNWMTVEVELSSFAGRKVAVELVNQPNGWSFETGYWGSIRLEEE
ncbi:MAG: HzsA-related protein [Planctomycetota bacterium]